MKRPAFQKVWRASFVALGPLPVGDFKGSLLWTMRLLELLACSISLDGRLSESARDRQEAAVDRLIAAVLAELPAASKARRSAKAERERRS